MRGEDTTYTINDKQKMIDSYKKYGYDFPMKAKYIRSSNRIYFSGDFKDGEEIEFAWNCDKPSANALGNAFYSGKHSNPRLININEIEAVD